MVKRKEKKNFRIGYVRVSKSDEIQEESLNEQKRLLETNGCQLVFSEKGSGVICLIEE